MAEAGVTSQSENDRLERSLLGRICRALAVAGGVILLAMSGLTIVSVLGRYFFNTPIPGDFELVRLLTAAAVSLFLPYCQLRRGNVIVDVFTAGLGPMMRAWLDTAGSLLLAVVAALLAWRLMVGGGEFYAAGDESMMLRMPSWWGFVVIVPCFALLAMTALATLAADLRRAAAERSGR